MRSFKWPWPFRIFEEKRIRVFTLGFMAVLVVLTVVDSLFADFEYIRAIDRLVVAAYFLFWMVLYWLRPGLFQEPQVVLKARMIRVKGGIEVHPGIADLLDPRKVALLSVAWMGVLVFVCWWLNNWWSYFVPAVGPLLLSLFLLRAPTTFLPGVHRGQAEVEGTEKFVVPLKSRTAKRILLLSGVLTSLTISTAMGVLLLLQTRPVGVSFRFLEVASLTFLFAAWSVRLQYHILLRWAFGSLNIGSSS